MIYPGLGQRALDGSVLDLWETVPKFHSRIESTFRGSNVRLEFDWKDVLEYAREKLSIGWEMDNSSTHVLGMVEMAKREAARVLTCDIDLDGPVVADELFFEEVRYLIRAFLRRLFLNTNVAFPGACTILYPQIIYPTVNAFPFQRAEGPLSGDMVSSAWDLSEESGWPPLGSISLEQVSDWTLRKLTHGNMTTDPEQRALMSLLHYCQSSEETLSLLWLTHALEALYRVPHNAVLENLKERLFLVLGRPIDSVNWKKRINNLYEIRSAIVHGRLDIPVPWEGDSCHINEDGAVVFERNAEQQEFQISLQRANDVAVSLLMSTIQVMVRNKWDSLAFETAFCPAEDPRAGTA